MVGAGPVGLAAAIFLDGLGYGVITVAPDRVASDERTSALLAGSIAFLERIGVWPRIVAAAAPMRSLRIVDATRRLIRAPEVLFHAAEIGLDAFGYNIPN
ncbi:MAG: FAD-dependent monooxygenase, partial [Bauldia sp.]|nr:FAD-dependent monooxygenase [Bauldia sp.]